VRRDVLPTVTVAACAVFVALCASLGSVWDGSAAISDLPVYERVGNAVEDGALPYRDEAVEYPPGALPAFVLPALVSDDHEGFARAFGALMVLCGVAAIVLSAVALRAVRLSAARLLLLAVAPLLTGALLLTRFDLYPTAVTIGAVAAMLAGRDRLGATVLGAAIAVKLWPAVLLPLLAAWVWRRKGRREAIVCLCAAAALVVLAFLPFLVASPDGVTRSIWRQLDRPLQIESLGASILLAAHHLVAMPLDWESSHGSQNLTGTAAILAAVMTSLVQLAALGWLWTRFAAGRAEPVRMARYAAATVVAFVALGKVLSPQFLIWLVPLVPLVAGRRGLVACALLAAACLLTRGWFPDRYWSLVKEFDEPAAWLVLLRNLVLVTLLVVIAAPVRARARVQARSPSPAPSAGRT
jgi:Glycosyltransferase family 87